MWRDGGEGKSRWGSGTGGTVLPAGRQLWGENMQHPASEDELLQSVAGGVIPPGACQVQTHLPDPHRSWWVIKNWKKILLTFYAFRFLSVLICWFGTMKPNSHSSSSTSCSETPHTLHGEGSEQEQHRPDGHMGTSTSACRGAPVSDAALCTIRPQNPAGVEGEWAPGLRNVFWKMSQWMVFL